MRNLKPWEPDFFIMGLPRSGTTLLATLLSESPDLFVINDSLLFRRFWRMQDKVAEVRTSGALKHYATNSTAFGVARSLNDRITLSQAKWFFAIIVDSYYYGGRSLDPTKNTARMATHADLLDVSSILEVVANSHLTWRQFLAYIFGSLVPAKHHNKTQLGEKTPGHILIADWIKEQYPDKKFIINIRNPKTNIASVYRRAITKQKNDFLHNQWYKIRKNSINKDFRSAIKYYKRYADPVRRLDEENENVIVVRYEDIVADPQAALDRICQFLEIVPFRFSGQFKAYSMTEYVGTRVDTQRGKNSMNTLNRWQEAYVSRACQELLETYYSG